MKKETDCFVFTVLAVALTTLVAGCGTIRTHRQIQQPVESVLTTGVGGTIFRLNKVGDLPNAFGGRDIWGGKVDKGFAQMKLASIDGDILTLEVLDIDRQSSETVMDRYKPFQQDTTVNVDVQTSTSIGAQDYPKPYEIRFDTRKQKDITISGIRVTFIEVQPYSVQYRLEDVQSK